MLSRTATNLLYGPQMFLSKLGRFFLASLIATNGVPALLASNATPLDRTAVVTDWANALGLSGNPAENEMASIDYWATGTVTVNGAPCVLTSYRATLNYRTPGMRVDFRCVDAAGQSHHEVHVVAGRLAWDEAGTGTTAATSAVNDR